MKYSARWCIIVTLFALHYLSGCTTTTTKPDEPVSPQPSNETAIAAPAPLGSTLSDAQQLEQTEHWLDAALIYTKIASMHPPPQRQSYKLKAVELLIKADLYHQAALMLKDIDQTTINAKDTEIYALHNAQITINNRDADTTFAWLSTLTANAPRPLSLQLKIHQLRISAYELQGNTQAAIKERILLNKRLPSLDAIYENQQTILRILTLIPKTTLENFSDTTQAPPTTAFQSWSELALLLRRARDPYHLANQITQWQNSHPDHPINNRLLQSLTPSRDEAPPTLDRIALLLPFDSPFQKAAEAVRDGFLTAYYAQDTQQNESQDLPAIDVYDTGQNPQDILSIYQTAIEAGASIVVGPLNKQAVDILAKSTSLPVPTIALNHLKDTHFYANNLYQFGLSPENEAQQIAQRAWLDGHNKAAIIYPQGKFGERISQAFQTYWNNLGGIIVGTEFYDAQQNDFSKPIKTLLQIDQSYERRRELNKLLRRKLNFEPRRRQDIDFIFMTAFPRQARLIPPQLKFHRAGKIPVYATSHSFNGKLNPEADRDLNGVTIGDMPWNLSLQKKQSIKASITQTWPENALKFSRLYALGVDAYRLLKSLNWLRANPKAQIHGVTGSLRIDENNHILRQLIWAKFKKGKPRLIPTTPILSSR